jgi:hypothetical protein
LAKEQAWVSLTLKWLACLFQILTNNDALNIPPFAKNKLSRLKDPQGTLRENLAGLAQIINGRSENLNHRSLF